MKKVLAIIGPTATGKTDVGLELAKKYQGELICCDSRQVYKGLDIGTGKHPGIIDETIETGDGYWKIGGIPIWLYDTITVDQQFTAKDFVDKTEICLLDVTKRNGLPIIVGGTGFYLKALLKGLDDLDQPVNMTLRQQLQNFTVEQLQEKLRKTNRQRFLSMNSSDNKNPRRLIRAIEVGKNSTAELKRDDFPYDVLIIGLTAPRDILNQRINQRVIKRIEQGMIEEAEELYKQGVSLERMRQLGLEYGCLADLLEGKIQKQEFIETLQTKIHQFAKRQMTWFLHQDLRCPIRWFDITVQDWQQQMANEVQNWYDQDDDSQGRYLT